MRRILGRAGLIGVVMLTAGVLAGCSSASGPDQAAGSSTPAAGGGDAAAPINIVTSTNVWGDVAAQIGGDQVAVTSLIADPAADPHSFEPNAQAQLALSKAALVVENGGGYDDFMQTMLQSANSTPPVLNAVEVSGKTASGDDALNEHVWYDLPSAEKVASRIADELTTIEPGKADFFQANLASFSDKIAGLTAKLDAIKAAHGGTDVAITEPVPLYLTEAAGLVNVTPPQFSAAIEEGTDVPPTVLADTLALFTGKKVAVLVYNEQTSSPETEQLLTAAKDNSIAVVGVTETLPEGKDYLSWMDANITALAGALG
jgi:zinc/manganese transport system substrate-binding protein